MSDIKQRPRPEPPKPQMPQQQQFGIQFVITRNGEPITQVITVQSVSVNLHLLHVPEQVWGNQVKVLTELVRAQLVDIDAFAGVIPDARPVGLQLPEKTALDAVAVPILKRINRVLLGAVERVSEYNRKRGRS